LKIILPIAPLVSKERGGERLRLLSFALLSRFALNPAGWANPKGAV